MSDAQARQLMRQYNWDPSPDEIFPDAGKPWTCTCMDCGTSYQKMLSHVQVGEGRCRNCIGLDISAQEATRIMLANDHEPIGPYPGSQEPWPAWCLRCRAKNRTTITTAHFSRIKYKGHRCRRCRGEKIAAALSYTDSEARSIMQGFGYEPQIDYPGSVDDPWRCIHLGTDSTSCGLTVRPTLHNILHGQGGCSTCARRGPDFAAPGYLYVVTRRGTGKVGIGGSKSHPNNDRLLNHSRQGWRKIARWDFDTLLEARSVEQVTVCWLRDRGVDWVPQEDMPYGGYTETFSLGEVEAADVVQFVTNYISRESVLFIGI